MRFKEKLKKININLKKVFLTILSLRKIFIRIISYMGNKLIKYCGTKKESEQKYWNKLID